jgi:hypothetical protein
MAGELHVIMPLGSSFVKNIMEFTSNKDFYLSSTVSELRYYWHNSDWPALSSKINSALDPAYNFVCGMEINSINQLRRRFHDKSITFHILYANVDFIGKLADFMQYYCNDIGCKAILYKFDVNIKEDYKVRGTAALTDYVHKVFTTVSGIVNKFGNRNCAICITSTIKVFTCMFYELALIFDLPVYVKLEMASDVVNIKDIIDKAISARYTITTNEATQENNHEPKVATGGSIAASTG